MAVDHFLMKGNWTGHWTVHCAHRRPSRKYSQNQQAKRIQRRLDQNSPPRTSLASLTHPHRRMRTHEQSHRHQTNRSIGRIQERTSTGRVQSTLPYHKWCRKRGAVQLRACFGRYTRPCPENKSYSCRPVRQQRRRQKLCRTPQKRGCKGQWSAWCTRLTSSHSCGSRPEARQPLLSRPQVSRRRYISC